MSCKFAKIRLAVLLVLFGFLSPVFSEDDNPLPFSHPTSVWIVSPLFGVAANENLRTGTSDVSPEYGLFVMYASPRFIANNTTFFTDVNKSEVWGNITSFGLYGDPDAKLTWFLGGSYVWHQITTDPVKLRVDEPLGKIGLVWRIPDAHLSINPYIGYAQETVHTRVSVSTPMGTMVFKDRDRSDIAVYGVSAYWHWRMLGADAKYYLSQDLDKDEVFQHFRVWATAMFSKRAGIIARFEYEEQAGTRDTSLLFGPVFVF